MESTEINKKYVQVEDEGQPRFELDQVRSDLPDHKGIKWVYLLCPYCRTKTNFNPIYLAIVRKDDEYGLMEKYFHLLFETSTMSKVDIEIYCYSSSGEYEINTFISELFPHAEKSSPNISEN